MDDQPPRRPWLGTAETPAEFAAIAHMREWCHNTPECPICQAYKKGATNVAAVMSKMILQHTIVAVEWNGYAVSIRCRCGWSSDQGRSLGRHQPWSGLEAHATHVAAAYS